MKRIKVRCLNCGSVYLFKSKEAVNNIPDGSVPGQVVEAFCSLPGCSGEDATLVEGAEI